MRVASIDCGTNSIRLLVADVDSAGALADIDRDMIVVRLGQGVDRTGEFAPEALERTFAAVDDFAARCTRFGVERLRFVATSATRDARNREAFVDGIRARLGVEPDVITGSEEAELSFRGATGAIPEGHPGPYLVVDLGGGSTELVLGDGEPLASHSMNVGCVRMTERHLTSDPPSSTQVELATRDIRAALDDVGDYVPLGHARTLVGLAGSVTTVTAHALGLDAYRAEVIDGAALGIDDAVAAADALLAMTHQQRARLPFMHPGRVDVIGAGALVWREVMLRVRAEVEASGARLDTVVTSEHDILDGIALRLAERSSL